MSLWDRVTSFMALQPWQEPELETRSEDSSIADLMARFNTRAEAWRPATVHDAMSVPAIFSAVTLISNTVGSLTMKSYRQGLLMGDADRPVIVKRPDPFRTPREFFMSTSRSLATRGEAWWLIAKRDIDGSPLSLIVLPAREIVVTDNERNAFQPNIEFRGTAIPNDDIVQIVLGREPLGLRGIGPLQACGAAVSVAVESMEWAANFYAEGGKGGTVVKSARVLGETPTGWSASAYDHEADILRAQWVARGHNLVRVIDPNIDSVEEHQPSEGGAQMLQTRSYTSVETAQMFNMPAPMIEAAVAGGSLTYQNIPSLFDSFVRRCLRPNYLEPIEQAMSDLLTRSTVARFNTDALLQDDMKTRFEVYESAVTKSGVLSVEEARTREGLEPGDIENAPVPLSPPQAIPVALEQRSLDMRDVRCPKCERLVTRSDGRVDGYCRHCKTSFASEPAALQVRNEPEPVVIPAPVVNFDMTPLVAAFAPLATTLNRIEERMMVPPPTVEAPVVNFHEGAFALGQPVVNVNVPEQQAPVVNIAAAEPAEPPVVNVTLPEQQAPVVNVTLPEPKPVRRTVERDADNKIIAISEAS